MKRNKKSARAMRNGKSPYARHDKKPCQHCQAVTAASVRRAREGLSEEELMSEAAIVQEHERLARLKRGLWPAEEF